MSLCPHYQPGPPESFGSGGWIVSPSFRSPGPQSTARRNGPSRSNLSLLCDEGCGANGAIFVPLRAGKEYPEKGEAFAMGTHSIASTGRFHPALPILGIRAGLDPRWSPIGG